MSPSLREEFESHNRLLVGGERPLTPEELAVWSRGRDLLVQRALARQQPVEGSRRRRHPRARARLSAHLAGCGSAFTDDVGFGGLSLRTTRRAALRRGDDAYVKLKWAQRSIFLEGQVAWIDGARIGLAITRIHPEDEHALQAVVCAGLSSAWES
ncbi:PilZ domain-containing protein [Anaeromyxobacter paludicola]|uniref:PilZ domain-containing protein n=1 Tax=Anaeromyxobacter paludicola TaxID=2918171 RepID=A0ABM7XFQ9_9BACT|nr:PilZ domain-containing protein [Anaeromyxobacter paludicola]BDG10716.1 hypothetical protein AMPC_38290 [Anaeromyxobacter paludicola]